MVKIGKVIILTTLMLLVFGVFSKPIYAAPAPPPPPPDPPGSVVSPNKGGCIDTALGCINFGDETGATFLGQVITISLGIAGGVAFLLILFSGFMIITSQANPDRLKSGQELLSSAIMGLLLVIFSVFILKFIGIDILKIDVFGT